MGTFFLALIVEMGSVRPEWYVIEEDSRPSLLKP